MTDHEIGSGIPKPTSEPHNSNKQLLSTPTQILQKRCYSLLKSELTEIVLKPELAGIEPASHELRRAALVTGLQLLMMTCRFSCSTLIPWQAPLQCRWIAFFAQILYWYRKPALSRTTSRSNFSITMPSACSSLSRCKNAFRQLPPTNIYQISRVMFGLQVPIDTRKCLPNIFQTLVALLLSHQSD